MQQGLARARLLPLLGTAQVLGVMSGTVLALRLWIIATWAVRRTLSSLRLMIPLVTGALPLLLLFVTFLFINMEVWLAGDDVAHVPGLAGLTAPLIKVSVFLAGFSGLYFSVVAVTDETYRGQFFTAITHEMERAVAVRAVYRQLD